MLHQVKSIQYLHDFIIFVVFDDGVSGELDFSELITFEGIFKDLKKLENFKKVFLDRESETITWTNGANFDSDVLYSHLTSSKIAL